MFYSHTFLARKGPLGTVWCAAHLQHRLKKTHYITTNVSSTVEKIMNPDVPIALRMSGHLLLGVVRIYSKQIDYFFEDCNEVRITINKAFTTVSMINLAGDATQAPFHSVTLPEKFNLDTIELEDYKIDWSEDSHLKRQDEITLTDQIPTGNDPYFVISFQEHDLSSSSNKEDNSGSGPKPMEEDDHPHVELGKSDAGFRSPSRSNYIAADGFKSPLNLRSVELMRDAQHDFDFNNSPILPDRADPDKFLEEQLNKDMEMHSPIREVVLPDAQFSSSRNHEEQHSPGHLDSQIPFVHHSPELEIHQTPVMEIQPTPPVVQPQVRRKRRQRFDTTVVLSNAFMREVQDDTSDILRARGNCPISSLAIWKHNNSKRLRKEGFFVEPSITGSSVDLQGMYKEDTAKHHLVTIQETHQETNVNIASSSRLDNHIEIEVLRNNEQASPERFMPPFSTPLASPSGRSHFTPQNSNKVLQSEHLEMTDGDGTLPTSNVGTSGNFDSEIRTPDAFDNNDMHFDNTVLSDIPEMVPSVGDLGFLNQDDDSPAGLRGTPEVGTYPGNQRTPELHGLSSRARAVAHYLKKQSATPISSNSGKSPEDLSLKKILEDKPKKICARMFYETLVLKNYGLVDVQQKEPYDDIIVKVTPRLSKEQFSD